MIRSALLTTWAVLVVVAAPFADQGGSVGGGNWNDSNLECYTCMGREACANFDDSFGIDDGGRVHRTQCAPEMNYCYTWVDRDENVAVRRGCTEMAECRDNTEFVNGQDQFNYCRTCSASLCNAGDAYVPNQQEGGGSSGGHRHHDTDGGGSQYTGAATALVTPALLLPAFLLTLLQ